jgi:putative hydrolase of the HAD superfamily
MIDKKILLLDMDGLVILRKEVFSVRISKKLNIPLDKVLPFIKNELQLCLVGKADLKEELKKNVSAWGWDGSIDDLLKFWFDGEKNVNSDLIKKINGIRQDGYKVYLVTNNEKYRVNFLWEDVGLKKYFDGVFSSAKVGFKKPDSKFYFKVLKLLKITPKDVIFWDDDKENYESAKEIGMDARFYTGIKDFKI